MAVDSSAWLLAAADRRPFGRVGVVRVTPGGRATRRETLFEPGVLARLWRPLTARLGPATQGLAQPPGSRTGRTSG